MPTLSPDAQARAPVSRKKMPPWVAGLNRFQQPSTPRALWQLANTLIPYLLLLGAMYVGLQRGWPLWVTVALVVLAAGFMVRLFILFHDCVHGSFIRPPWARRLIGRVLGLLVFTPFTSWGLAHLGHHVTSGDLDRRGTGDIWTMTVEEYRAASRWKRLRYRLYRHPVVMLCLGPSFSFLIVQRIPRFSGPKAEWRSVLWTNVALAGVVAAASLTIGLKAYLLIQLPVFFVGGAAGVWLFYVQHQFDPSFWIRSEQWTPLAAALQGSSYYKLPKVLQWISGNIGLHHVHHLLPRVPNYNLQRCLDATPELQLPNPLTLRESLKAMRLNLWDEGAGRFVRFRDLRSATAGNRPANPFEPPSSAAAVGAYRFVPPGRPDASGPSAI